MLGKFWLWYLSKSWYVFFPQVPDIKKSKLSIKLGLFAGINVFWKVAPPCKKNISKLSGIFNNS